MSVTAPADRKFRRANVRPGSRRRTRPRWAWRLAAWGGAVLLVAYAGFRATQLVVHASVLQVRRIAVHGNVRLSSGDVRAIVDGLRGSSILTVNLAAYRRRLLESPWVGEVALRRVLPSTVEIFVSERQPIGLCRLGTALYLVDAQGTLIDEFGPEYAEFDLPIIDGLVRAPSSGQPAVDEQRAALADRVIEALAPRKDLASRVSQIDVHDVHDAVVLLQHDPALLHLGEDHFLERLESYVELAPALRDRVPDIDYVDLRFKQRLYVRPAALKRAGVH